MSDKRFMTEEEREQAPRLPISLPIFDDPSPPFSRGLKTEVYTPAGLKKVSGGDTSRTHQFIKLVFAISERIGGAVPFAFRTADGTYRSLDAGCVGFCVNETTPRLTVETSADGYITSVSPTKRCHEIYGPMLPKLLDSIEPR